MNSSQSDIYQAGFVKQLFDEMAGSYERVNYITSFGFSSRWRRQFVANCGIRPGAVVYDLMTGMGECWREILKFTGDKGRICAVDFSEGMLRLAEKRRQRYANKNITISKSDVLSGELPSATADHIVIAFGCKTFESVQIRRLATEVERLLKPGGSFSLVEISVPPARLLAIPYMVYLRFFIPLLGKIFLGNPDNYRMLGVYTSRFGDARETASHFAATGLNIRYHNYFFGCATGVSGRKEL